MTVPIKGTRTDNILTDRQYKKTIYGLPLIFKILGRYYILKQSPQSVLVNSLIYFEFSISLPNNWKRKPKPYSY